MKIKNNIDDIIGKYSDLYSPVLKEYMLLPAYAFFRHIIKNTEEYLGEKEAGRCRAYTEKIKTALTAVNDDTDEMENPCLKDIIAMGLNKRDERFSEAILYCVLIYPFKIISKIIAGDQGIPFPSEHKLGTPGLS